MSTFVDFISWEQKSRDTIDFKKIYVDMSGDLEAGLLLSQIVYWHLPDRDGNTRLRVTKDDHLWVVKSATEWWEEVRLTPNAVRRAIRILIKRKLILTCKHRFNGAPTIHVRIDESTFTDTWQAAMKMTRADVMQMIRDNRGFKPESAKKMAEGKAKKREMQQHNNSDLSQCDKTEIAQPDKSDSTRRDKCLTETPHRPSENTLGASAPPPPEKPMTPTDKKRDPVIDAFERHLQAQQKPHETIVRSWNLPPHLEQLCLWFVEDMGVTVVKGDKGKYARGASQLYEFHISREQHREICKRARAQKARDGQRITYGWPGALMEMARQVVSEPAQAKAAQPAERIVGYQPDANGAMIPIVERCNG